MTNRSNTARRMAVMGGAYGNVPALRACLQDAAAHACDTMAFIGDAIGCCGHSDEVAALVRERFDVLVAGNHEQQAARGATTCGCGYASAEDERLGCVAFEHALASLSEANRQWLGTWPREALVDAPHGRVLLCHGSPEATNEFLYESELEGARLEGWLDAYDVVGMICTHTGLPWVRRLGADRFAANCGVVGKPDHDGDPAVHYALVDLTAAHPSITIRRVAYDHVAWADRLAREGVDEVFTEPLRTGVWTTGVASLPTVERRRLERRRHRSSG